MKEVSDGEGAVADMTPGASRRQLLTGGVATGLAAAGAAVSVPSAAYSGTVDDIPELAPQWKKTGSCRDSKVAGCIHFDQPIQVAL